MLDALKQCLMALSMEACILDHDANGGRGLARRSPRKTRKEILNDQAISTKACGCGRRAGTGHVRRRTTHDERRWVVLAADCRHRARRRQFFWRVWSHVLCGQTGPDR